MIEIKNLTYIIGEKKILDNLNFKIKKGKITGILGPNGSGKTTLLKHLSKEIPTEKNITINNEFIENIKRKKFSKLVSFISQDFENIDEFIIYDIVKMGRYPYKKLFFDYSKKDIECVKNMIRKFNLEEIKEQKSYKVSGGELKRAFIARSMAQGSDIMLLDEPINHLDIKYQLELMKMLVEFKEKTIVMSMHSIELALRFCEDIILMKDGKIIKYGDTKEVLNSLNIYEIFDVKTEILDYNNRNIIIYE